MVVLSAAEAMMKEMNMSEKVIVWVHGDCLSPDNPALQAYPDAPALWVWDDVLLDEWQISLKRIVFIYECLLELPVTIRRGDLVAELREFAVEHGAARIVTAESPSPRFRAICQNLRNTLPVEMLPVEPFIDYNGKIDLKRFSRYWQVAQRYAFD
jgi:hypothetical protein